MRGSSARRWYRRCSPPRSCGHALTVRAFRLTFCLGTRASRPPPSTGAKRSGTSVRQCCKPCFNKSPPPSRLHPLGLVEVLDWTAAALDRVDHAAFFAHFNEGDAVPYFYEPFLEAFGPALHKQLGVWYTPAEASFRHLWGQTKREALGETAEAEPTALYESIQPVLPLGLPFTLTAVSEGWSDWPALPELLPVSFPGVKTSRDGFLVDVDLERLKARVTEYFDKALSHKGNRVAVSECDEDHGAVRRAGRARDLAGAWRPERSRVHPIRVPPVRPSLALLGGGWRAA